MEDGFARDGVLTRCNMDREATLNDAECINARRAAAALAIEAERSRAAGLERASDAARLALREREAQRAALEQEQEATARSAAEAAYEAQWRDPALPRVDVYANGSDALARPALQVTVERPSNDLVIAPRIELTELDAVPRPFRTADEE